MKRVLTRGRLQKANTFQLWLVIRSRCKAGVPECWVETESKPEFKA